MTRPRSRSLRVGRVRIGWLTVLWLAVLWVLLWGELSVGNLLAGLVVGILVTVLLPLPAIGFRGRVRPLGVLRLVGHFVVDLVLASVQVALIALHPSRTPTGAVIGVHLRSESDLYLAFTAELSTLVPGSLVVEAHRRNGMLYLHVLDVESMGGIEAVRSGVLAIEERVLRALASDAELERAGLGRSTSREGETP
jgi:multicomponent Na+:H+ antiporter subunit E